MNAIPTHYKGYHFRSRLEARWAVFFDALDLQWEYEKEGYDLGEHGWYLPDFWLPDVNGGTWVEVKPEAVDHDGPEESKLMALCEMTGWYGMLVYGDPYGNLDLEDAVDWHMMRPSFWDNFYLFCLCPWCGKVGIQFEGRGARVCGWQAHHKTEDAALDAIRHMGHWRADDKCYTYDDPRIVAAATAARAARFEFGARR